MVRPGTADVTHDAVSESERRSSHDLRAREPRTPRCQAEARVPAEICRSDAWEVEMEDVPIHCSKVFSSFSPKPELYPLSGPGFDLRVHLCASNGRPSRPLAPGNLNRDQPSARCARLRSASDLVQEARERLGVTTGPSLEGHNALECSNDTLATQLELN